MKQLLLLLTLPLLMIGCGGSDTKPRPPTKPARYLRLNTQTEPMSLDPRLAIDRRSQVVTRMLFEGLTRIGRDNTPEPAMAEEIEISPDGKIYTFHLREAFWSNGEPVSALDFAYAWESLLTADVVSPFAFYLDPIRGARQAREGKLSIEEVGIRVVSDRTLVIELEHSTPYFLDFIANPLFSPVPRHLARHDDHWANSSKKHISNGPFRLTTWKKGKEIRVEQNPYYWDLESVKLDGIALSMVDDSQSMLLMFENGELDWAGEPLSELPLDALLQLRNRGILHTAKVGAIHQYKFNTERAPFHSAKMRKAFATAIDRQSLVDHILHGGEEVAGSILPPHLTLNQDGYIQDGDAEAARRLFDEALAEQGITRNQLPPIVLSYATIEGHKAIAQAVQQQWKTTFGLPIAIEGSEWNVFFSRQVTGDFQVGGAVWFSIYNDPLYNLEHVKYKSLRYNSTRWENPTYVALLDSADNELNPIKRREYLADAEELVMDQMPLSPLFVATYNYVCKDQVKGIYISPNGSIDFKWTFFGGAS